MQKLLTILFLISSLCWLGSCTRTNETLHTLSGTYAGTFDRYQWKDGGAATVHISFTESGFSGGSDSSGFPLICAGTYNISVDSILFVNSCDYAPGTNMTLVLNGKYTFVEKGDSLFIRRVYGDFVYQEDVYRLRKQ